MSYDSAQFLQQLREIIFYFVMWVPFSLKNRAYKDQY